MCCNFHTFQKKTRLFLFKAVGIISEAEVICKVFWTFGTFLQTSMFIEEVINTAQLKLRLNSSGKERTSELQFDGQVT